MRTNKTQEILKYLQEHGSITSMEAFHKFGVTRLAAIIFNLRERGHDIDTQMTREYDRYGNVCDFARYIYHEV